MAGNNLLHMLRGSSTSATQMLNPGQPFYNYAKNYLTVGGRDGTTGTNGKPIAARELVGYLEDTDSAIGNSTSELFKIHYANGGISFKLNGVEKFKITSAGAQVTGIDLNNIESSTDLTLISATNKDVIIKSGSTEVARLDGSLVDIKTAAKIAGKLNCSNSLEVAGTTTLNNTLTVNNGLVTLNKGLKVTGDNTIIEKDLSVSGESTFAADLNVNANAFMKNNTTIFGKTTTGDEITVTEGVITRCILKSNKTIAANTWYDIENSDTINSLILNGVPIFTGSVKFNKAITSNIVATADKPYDLADNDITVIVKGINIAIGGVNQNNATIFGYGALKLGISETQFLGRKTIVGADKDAGIEFVLFDQTLAKNGNTRFSGDPELAIKSDKVTIARELHVGGNILPKVNDLSCLGSSDMIFNCTYSDIVNVKSKIVPSSPNSGYIGDSSNYFNYAYIKNIITSAKIEPSTANTVSLGSSSKYFKDAYINTIRVSNKLIPDTDGANIGDFDNFFSGLYVSTMYIKDGYSIYSKSPDGTSYGLVSRYHGDTNSLSIVNLTFNTLNGVNKSAIFEDDNRTVKAASTAKYVGGLSGILDFKSSGVCTDTLSSGGIYIIAATPSGQNQSNMHYSAILYVSNTISEDFYNYSSPFLYSTGYTDGLVECRLRVKRYFDENGYTLTRTELVNSAGELVTAPNVHYIAYTRIA